MEGDFIAMALFTLQPERSSSALLLGRVVIRTQAGSKQTTLPIVKQQCNALSWQYFTTPQTYTALSPSVQKLQNK